MDQVGSSAPKPHRAPRSGAKARKKESKRTKKLGNASDKKNPRAFGFSGAAKGNKRLQRNADRSHLKEYVPRTNRVKDA